MDRRLYKRNGIYWADLRAIGRGRVSPKTKDRAVAKARLREAELAQTDHTAHQSQGLVAAIDSVLEVHRATKAPATKKSYEQKARHLVRVLEDVDVNELTHRNTATSRTTSRSGSTRERRGTRSTRSSSYYASRSRARRRPGCFTGRSTASYCAKAGIDPATPNDLRRTIGSWLKQAGVDSKTVADLMGHTTTRMVDAVYGQLSEQTYRDAIAKLPRSAGRLTLVR